MTVQLNWLDYSLVVAYILAVLYIGLRSGRRETSEGFLLADRNLSALESAATICASKTGAGIMLTYLSFIYLFGIGALWFFIGSIAGYGLFYFFVRRIKPLADEHGFYTLSDYFFHTHGPYAGYSSALMLLAFFLLTMGTQLIAGSKILSEITPLSYGLSLLVMSAVIITYIAIGGFRAVTLTDYIQYGAIVLLTLVLGIFLWKNFTYVPADWDFFAIGPGLVAGFFLIGIIWPFGSAELWQRVYATRSVGEAQRGLLFAMALYIGYGVLLSIAGIIVRNAVEVTDPDIALVAGFGELLPAGVIGLGIVVLYAAVMSSADTVLFTSASITIQDFLDRIRERSKRDIVKDMRIAAVVIGIGGWAAAALVPNLVDITFIYASLLSALAVLVLITWFYTGVTDKVFASALLAGGMAVLVGLFFFTDERLFYLALTVTLFALSAGAVASKMTQRI